MKERACGEVKTRRKRTSELLALDDVLAVDLDVLEDGRSVADSSGNLLGVVELVEDK